MSYLITQLLFFLVIAALIGFIIGWLLRRSLGAKHERDLISELSSRVSVAEHGRDRYEQQARNIAIELTALESRFKQSQDLLAGLQRELERRNLSAVDSEKEFTRWEGKLALFEKKLGERNAEVVSLQSEVDRFAEVRGRLEDREGRLRSYDSSSSRGGAGTRRWSTQPLVRRRRSMRGNPNMRS